MKNKISQALLLVTLYLMAGAAANANEVPKDYAYGLPLITPGAEPFLSLIHI